MRYVEDLDAARERAAVTQEELASRLSDRMNRTLYLLTIMAIVLLPPSLLTGLLGINVGGMPGVENPWAFAIVFVLIILLGSLRFGCCGGCAGSDPAGGASTRWNPCPT